MLILHRMATELGVTVVDGDPGRGRLGCYIDRLRLIVLRPGIRTRTARYVLAHELGHAVRRDQHTGDKRFDRIQEARADQFAARLLIDPTAVARAEELYGPCSVQIARDLDIPVRLLAVWRDQYQRTSA